MPTCRVSSGDATNTGLTVTPIINDINVGIILQVTPRTSPDGTIVMQIYAEKSTVGPDATGIPIAIDANGNAIRSPQIPGHHGPNHVLRPARARRSFSVVSSPRTLEEDTRRVSVPGRYSGSWPACSASTR